MRSCYVLRCALLDHSSQLDLHSEHDAGPQLDAADSPVSSPGCVCNSVHRLSAAILATAPLFTDQHTYWQVLVVHYIWSRTASSCIPFLDALFAPLELVEIPSCLLPSEVHFPVICFSGAGHFLIGHIRACATSVKATTCLAGYTRPQSCLLTKPTSLVGTPFTLYIKSLYILNLSIHAVEVIRMVT